MSTQASPCPDCARYDAGLARECPLHSGFTAMRVTMAALSEEGVTVDAYASPAPSPWKSRRQRAFEAVMARRVETRARALARRNELAKVRKAQKAAQRKAGSP